MAFYCGFVIVAPPAVCVVQVYGSDDARGAALRSFTRGKLLVDATPVGNMPPRNVRGLPNSNGGFFPANQMFLAGGPSHGPA